MKFTIITVVYNGEATIEKTIESVNNQTYKDIEYIVVDGGSTDKTVEIIKRYSRYITKWISEPDGGIYDAMNKGISMATGDVIGILNADDTYYPSTISIVKKAMADAPEFDGVYGNTNYVRRIGNLKIRYEVGADSSFDFIKTRMICCHQALFLKKSCYDKHGFYDPTFKIVSDQELLTRIFMSGGKLKLLNSPVTEFNIGGFSSENRLLTIREQNRIRKKYQFEKLSLLPYFKVFAIIGVTNIASAIRSFTLPSSVLNSLLIGHFGKKKDFQLLSEEEAKSIKLQSTKRLSKIVSTEPSKMAG